MQMTQKKIHILEMFGEPIAYGGQEMFVNNLLRRFPKGKFRIDCFTPFFAHNEDMSKLLSIFDGEIYHLDYKFEIGTGRVYLYKPVKEFLLGKKYDIVHIHTGSTAIMCVFSLAARQAGIERIICHSHCTGDKKGIKYSINKLIAGCIFKYAVTDYLACSLAAGKWKYLNKVVKNKLITVNNGIDIEKFRFDKKIRADYRAKLCIKESEILLGNVGRLSYQKNQTYIIKVLYELRKTDTRYKLIFVGDGEDKELLKRYIEKYKLQDNVIFTGNRKDVNCLMCAMDVFVLPSRFEGLPIVGIEAQTNGLPVIASSKITRELSIIDVKYVDIANESIVRWAEEIKSTESFGRENAYKAVLKEGYSLENTAQTVMKLYLKENK